jgi:protoporphyrinogen/coproporphyrinogen III oxidase
MTKITGRNIAVAGGGISGLTTAILLKKAGHRVKVFEALPEPGGAIGTDSENGWLAEKGPNSILLTNRYILELIDSLDLSDHIVEARPEAKNRYIVKNGKPVVLPVSLLSFVRSPLFSARAKLRLMKEPFIPSFRPMRGSITPGGSGSYIGPGPDRVLHSGEKRPQGIASVSDQNYLENHTADLPEDESLASFVRRRLGQEFLDYAINPFVSGVYAGDPEKLSVKYAFPKLYALEQEYGSLIRGQIFGAIERRKREETGRNRARMISFRAGLEELTGALKTGLGECLVYTSRVTAVRRGHAKPVRGNPKPETGYFLTVNGEEEGPFEMVISACNSHDVAGWEFNDGIQGSPADMGNISHPPVTSITLGYQKKDISHPLDGFGMLVPEVEPFRILGTLFTSSIFDGRAPTSGHATLTTYVGGTRNPDTAGLPDETLLELVKADLAKLLGVSGEPKFVRIYRWQKAIPQYNTGYGGIKKSISRFESDNPGFYLLGNYRNGISVPDCIKAAYELAGSIAEDNIL